MSVAGKPVALGELPLLLGGVDAGLQALGLLLLGDVQEELPHGRALVDEASSAGVLLSTFQNRRWDSDFRTLQTLVAAGSLGRVTRLESRFERWRPTLGGGWREQAVAGQAGGVVKGSRRSIWSSPRTRTR